MQAESTYQKVVDLWKSFALQGPSALRQHLDDFRILFAYHSGKIENDAISYDVIHDIFHDDWVRSFTGNPRTIFEQQNQKMCYEFLVSKILKKEPITIDLVKEIHAILTAGTMDERLYIQKGERPGQYKKHDYITDLLEVGSSPGDVPLHMDSLLLDIGELTSDESLPPENLLKAGAYFHAKFEYIHPFADGSGRVGRTLLNYFLMTKAHPPLIIHEEDREQYFESLRAYDRHEDIEPMYRFLLFSLEKTWEKRLEGDQGGKKDKRLKQEDLLKE